MSTFKKLFLHSFKHYCIAVGSFLAIVMIFMWIDKFNLSQFPSAFASAGMLVLFAGLLLMLGYFGAFDTIGYAFTTFKTRSRRPYKDLVEYTEIKTRLRKEKELYFMPYIVVGLIFAILGFVNWLFVRPNPKLDTPDIQKVEVLSSENKIIIRWDNNKDAKNGYHIEYREYYEDYTDEIPGEYFSKDEKIEQADGDTVTYTLEVPDLSKKYIVFVVALKTDKNNGSEKGTYIYTPE